jgi:hypothetical protein
MLFKNYFYEILPGKLQHYGNFYTARSSYTCNNFYRRGYTVFTYIFITKKNLDHTLYTKILRHTVSMGQNLGRNWDKSLLKPE